MKLSPQDLVKYLRDIPGYALRALVFEQAAEYIEAAEQKLSRFESAQGMEDTICPRCNGTSSVALTGFADPAAKVEHMCGICKGSGKLPPDIDALRATHARLVVELEDVREKYSDEVMHKLLAMSDEQVKALCRLEGHDPDDEAKIMTQIGEIAMLRVELAALKREGWVSVPVEPSDGLLVSMAIRSDHGLGVDGYYDSEFFAGSGATHQERLKATVSSMRQLHEEIVGKGFYKPESDSDYRAMLTASRAKGETK